MKTLTVQEIEKRILASKPLILPGFSKIVKRQANHRAQKISAYLHLRAYRADFLCEHCGLDSGRPAKKGLYWDVLDSPWDKAHQTIGFCSEQCEQDYRDESFDFKYQDCECCNRTIISQNPKNGWMSYFRYREEHEGEICLKCYEEQLVKEGVSDEELEAAEIPGMFFNRGDLEKKRFKEIEHSVHVRGKEDSAKLCKQALELKAKGYIVVFEYEHMAIGGLEGYVNLWAKRVKSGKQLLREMIVGSEVAHA